jgi:Holliday junction resolvase RusA-like endonuclease
MKITLDVPPSANRYWRLVNGRMIRSREANDYKDYVALHCAISGIQPLQGEVCVSVDVYRPAKRGDLDNFLKVAIDSLIGYAYADDSQIVELHAMRHDDKDDPRIEIQVMQL